MPEDSNPGFSEDENEQRLVYFTLPMALNYQRDSYNLWNSVLATWSDAETRDIFDIHNSATLYEDQLRTKLPKYKIALQPNKHVATWNRLSQTVDSNWGSLSALFQEVDNDYLRLRDVIQGTHKKDFPYLSGPKIFNYWSFIISTYGKIDLKNRQFIEIAPDTHVTKCSVKLGLITAEEASRLSKVELATKWRVILEGVGIEPIDMHPPLWFWSKNNFSYELSRDTEINPANN